MNKLVGLLALAVTPLIAAGCNECENGYKVKTEHRTIFFHEQWHENPKDTLRWRAKDTNKYLQTLACSYDPVF
jgi:hypothetical protein